MPGRSEDAGAGHEGCGNGGLPRQTHLHVTGYRWFDLRDDYSPKPAFGVYRELVAKYSGAAGSADPVRLCAGGEGSLCRP